MSSTNPDGYEKFSMFPSTTGILVLKSKLHQNQPLTKNKNSWSSALRDCFSDRRNRCITCWCPCMTFGQITEVVDKGSSCKCMHVDMEEE